MGDYGATFYNDISPTYATTALGVSIPRRGETPKSEEACEQKAQLMIWIGRLVGFSNQYKQEYIDAFQKWYVGDWDHYIIAAQEQFRPAAKASSRDRWLEA